MHFQQDKFKVCNNKVILQIDAYSLIWTVEYKSVICTLKYAY